MSQSNNSDQDDSNVQVYREGNYYQKQQIQNELQRDYGIKFEVSINEGNKNVTKSSDVNNSKETQQSIPKRQTTVYENPILYPDEIETTNLKTYKVKKESHDDEPRLKDKTELGKSTDLLNEKFKVDESVTEILKKTKRKSEILLILICILTAILSIAILAHLMSLKNSLQVNQKSSKEILNGSSFGVSESVFGYLENGEQVKVFELSNKNGLKVEVLSFGATLHSMKIKDISEKYVNIIVGLNTLKEYVDLSPGVYLGSVVGRTSNRITRAEFTLDGKTYVLDQNDGLNHLHGGHTGLSFKNWKSSIIDDGVKFSIFSPDGDGGYPGDVYINVVYKLNSTSNRLTIEYNAKTNKPTPIDLTNHAYFNLNGHDSNIRTVYNHELKINSDFYLQTNSEHLTTGEILSVENTFKDFRSYTRLGDRITETTPPQDGYDSYFIINQQSGMKHVASVLNRQNGLKLDIWSDQNGVQFYSGSYLNITKPSDGKKYVHHGGLCLESHNYPDSVNKRLFPSSIVKPEGEYRHTTVYAINRF